jgi:hypothetical protein
MKNYEYPTWLVSLDIAQELKEIGFDEPCTFAINYTQYIEPFLVQHRNKGYNAVFYGEVRMLKYETLDKDLLDKIAIIPTWEQVFAWFREKGYESYIKLESHSHFDEGNYYYFEITNPNLYQLDWQGDFDDYNEAREVLVKALIRTYKQEQPIISENE